VLSVGTDGRCQRMPRFLISAFESLCLRPPSRWADTAWLIGPSSSGWADNSSLMRSMNAQYTLSLSLLLECSSAVCCSEPKPS
jgi:hypothetical protein